MILSIEQEQEFWEFFYKEINLEDYKYKFLRENIQRINQGTQSIDDFHQCIQYLSNYSGMVKFGSN